MKNLTALTAAGLLFIGMGCGSDKKAPSPAPAPDNSANAAVGNGAANAEPDPAKVTAPAWAKPNAAVLADPSKATAKAPDKYSVEFDTTKGKFTIDVTRAWAPNGADRFYNLVQNGYFTDLAFFRVIKGFMAQFGIHGDPKIAAVWREARLKDDPVSQTNSRGRLTFATAGPNTRTTQFFINFGDNKRLDNMGFSPFGEIAGDGMKVVDTIYNGYGEGAPRGRGPDQGRAQREGNAYFKKDFPELDYIKSARVVPQK